MQPLDPIAVPLTGVRLIEASAGTGKTFAITTLYVRLVVERGLRVDEILVVTYTRAATAELRDRLRARLRQALTAITNGGDPDDPDLDRLVQARITTGAEAQARARLVAALRAFDQAAIYTIHSFCQRTLQDSAFESGVSFDTEFMTDQGPLISEIALDFWAREIYDAPEPFVRSLLRPHDAVTPALLTQLARQAVANREVPTLPGRPTFDDTAGRRWTDAQARAAAVWATEREHIIDLLANSTALKKNMYKADNIRGPWAQAIDDMLGARPTSGALDLKILGKFTEAGIANGCKKNCQPPHHPLFEICGEMVDVADDFAARELALLLDLITYARKEIQSRKSAAQVQSFDDLLYQLRDAVCGPGGDELASKIRERYRAALIDEFQDTDPVQYQVFRTVYQSASAGDDLSLFLIGDPKQAIYGFRGADVFTYMSARGDAGAASNTLDTNWRSDPALIAGVNTVFAAARDPFIFDGIEFAPVKARPGADNALGGTLAEAAPLQLLFVPRTGRTGKKDNLISKTMAAGDLPAGIAGRIATLLSSDATIDGVPVSPGDIAVLCRTNRQATHMQRALRALAVPSVLDGDASVFDSEQAEALGRVLLAMVEPGSTRAIRSALVTVMMGVSGDELCALQADEEAWDRWLQLYRRWQRSWKDEGFIQAFRRMIADHGVDRRLLELTDGERRLTNLYHLGELLQAEVMASRAGPQALLRWFELMCADKAARGDAVGDSAQIRLESDADAVKLVTVHKSKGLEYPIVYCPFLWDGALLRMNDAKWIRFHDSDDGDRLKLDLCSEDHPAHKQLAEREALAENLRLLYVALTRARHMCTVVWGAFRAAGSSPLAYVLHQPATFTTDPDGLKKLAKHVKGLSDDELIEELEELVAAGDGSIGLSYFDVQPVPAFAPASKPAGTLSCRQARRRLRTTGRLSSFSALVASDTSGAQSRGQERDHDADHDATSATALTPAATDTDSQVPLHDFPRGARAGHMFHNLLETIDFCAADPQTLFTSVDSALVSSGYDGRLAEQLSPAITGMLLTPLAGDSATMTLAELTPEQRLVELEFIFPVAAASAAMTATGLADAFRSRTAAPWLASYPDRLQHLDFAPLAGYLRGYADLVFRHQGRWYLVDYKSNFLGPSTSDYERSHLAEAMAHHHYFLQYHIYLVALHRYLRLRVKDYDYERHFGGVFYLFLRGMAPGHPPDCGVFHDRPPLTLVSRLSSLVGEPANPGVNQ